MNNSAEECLSGPGVCLQECVSQENGKVRFHQVQDVCQITSGPWPLLSVCFFHSSSQRGFCDGTMRCLSHLHHSLHLQAHPSPAATSPPGSSHFHHFSYSLSRDLTIHLCSSDILLSTSLHLSFMLHFSVISSFRILFRCQ